MRVGEEEGWLCLTCLGLTLYLPEAPTREQVLAAWDAYRAVCPPDRMQLVKSVRMLDFEPLERPEDPRSVIPYLADQDERLDEGLMVWDGELTDFWSFTVQGVVMEEVDAASFCHFLFPSDTNPDAILWLARGLAERLPFLSGHAGYTCVFDPSRKAGAFDAIYAWSKRYLGLEVEDLSLTLPLVLDAAKGANWLTLLGTPLLERAGGVDALRAALPPLIDVFAGRNGVVLRAGEAPVLADRNRGEFPDAYAAVEAALQPIKLREHPEFVGRFEEEEETMPWLCRLVQPEEW